MFKNLFGGKKEKFYAKVEESQIVEAAAPETAPEPVAAVEEAAPVAEEATPKSKSKKTSVKKKEKTTPAPVAVVAPPAPKKVEPTQVTFASTSPVSQTLERRLPGPSLGKFKEMARQVKTR